MSFVQRSGICTGRLWRALVASTRPCGSTTISSTYSPNRSRTALRESSAPPRGVEVLRHLVRAGEDAQLDETLLEPQPDGVCALLAGVRYFLGDLAVDRLLEVRIGDPGGRDGWHQRGEHGKEENAAPDAVESQHPGWSRNRLFQLAKPHDAPMSRSNDSPRTCTRK